MDIFNPHLKIRSHGELDWRNDARQLRTKIQLHLKRLVDIRKIRSKEAGSRALPILPLQLLEQPLSIFQHESVPRGVV